MRFSTISGTPTDSTSSEVFRSVAGSTIPLDGTF